MAVAPIDWTKLIKKPRTRGDLSLLSGLIEEARQHPLQTHVIPQRLHLLHQLEEAPASRRLDLLSTYIRAQVNDILQFDSSHPVEASQGFFQIGMDSLMAVELQHRLQSALGVSLPSTLSFDQPNIESLATYVLETSLSSKLPKTPEAVPVQEPARASNDIDALSEEELVELLAQELHEEVL